MLPAFHQYYTECVATVGRNDEKRVPGIDHLVFFSSYTPSAWVSEMSRVSGKLFSWTLGFQYSMSILRGCGCIICRFSSFCSQ